MLAALLFAATTPWPIPSGELYECLGNREGSLGAEPGEFEFALELEEISRDDASGTVDVRITGSLWAVGGFAEAWGGQADETLRFGPEGVWLIHSNYSGQGMAYGDGLRIVPANPTPGDQWTASFQWFGSEASVDFEVLEPEEIQTRMGIREAVHIRAIYRFMQGANGEYTVDSWYFPGVGPVKQSVRCAINGAEFGTYRWDIIRIQRSEPEGK